MRIEVIKCPPVEFPSMFKDFVCKLSEETIGKLVREVVTDIFHDGEYHYITLSLKSI